MINKKQICVALTILNLLILTCIHAMSDEVSAVKIKERQELIKIQNELVETFKNKNYVALKKYVVGNEKIDWGRCGPHDVEPIKNSFIAMVDILSKHSKDAQIYANVNPGTGYLDERIGLYTAVIQTEGWIGEYPYFDFSFAYNLNDLSLKWIATCYDALPPISEVTFTRDYRRKPSLPRPGPRVFKDRSALRARIEEIIRFKELESLKPYATRQKIVFAECNQEPLIGRDIKSRQVPVEHIVDFLKKESSPETKIKFRGYYDLETEGWVGEYPYILFRSAEGEKGWEWSTVIYCKNPMGKGSFTK